MTDLEMEAFVLDVLKKHGSEKLKDITTKAQKTLESQQTFFLTATFVVAGNKYEVSNKINLTDYMTLALKRILEDIDRKLSTLAITNLGMLSVIASFSIHNANKSKVRNLGPVKLCREWVYNTEDSALVTKCGEIALGDFK